MTKEPYKTVVALDFTKVEALRGHLHLNQRHMAKELGVSRMP
jgi:DNA-binding XRE family transcriptional regulator